MQNDSADCKKEARFVSADLFIVFSALGGCTKGYIGRTVKTLDRRFLPNVNCVTKSFGSDIWNARPATTTHWDDQCAYRSR